MEIEGKVIAITEAQSGVSKNGNIWQKQGFVIETTEQYPKRIFFELFGADKMSMLPNIGDNVRVSFDLSSSEHGGRWYTQASAWRVSKLTIAPIGQPQAPQSYAPCEMPTNNNGLQF